MEDNIPIGGLGLQSIDSNPPSGKCKVINIYIDPLTGKLIIEYDNIPKD